MWQPILFFIMVGIAAMMGVLPVAVVGTALFCYWFDGRWLIAGAILMDGYFGAFATIPMATIIVTVLYLAIEIMKPLVRTM